MQKTRITFSLTDSQIERLTRHLFAAGLKRDEWLGAAVAGLPEYKIVAGVDPAVVNPKVQVMAVPTAQTHASEKNTEVQKPAKLSPQDEMHARITEQAVVGQFQRGDFPNH